MLGLGSSLIRGGASLLTFIKDNLKLYLDFKSNRSDTLAFPSEGSTNFDGSDDFINCGSDTSLALATDFTISVWFNSDDVTGYERLVNRGSYNSGFIFGLNDDNLDFTFKDADDASHTALAGGTNITANRWYHGVVVSNSSTGKVHVYLNGVDDGNASITHPIQTPSADFRIGSDGGSHFNGKIANVGVWSRALSLEEINSVMNKSYSQLSSVEKTSLVSWWAMDTMSGEENTLSEDGGRGVITDLVSGSGSENLGTELVPNNIITSTQFTLSGESGGSISNGILRINTSGASQFANDADLLESGKLYKVVAVVSDATSGELYFRSGNKYAMGLCGTVGTHIGYVEANSTNLMISRNSGSEATDISINSLSVREVLGNTGLIKGATTTTSVYGGNAPILPRAIDIAESFADAIGNGSASFDGNTDYIDFGADVYDFSSGDFTLTAWIYHDTSHNKHSGIFGIRDTTNTEVQFYINHASEQLGSWNGSGNVFSGSTIPNKEWTHVALVQSSGNKKFYINGILVNIASQANGTARPATLKIGFTGHSNEYLLGNVSQAGIWAGELSQEKIQSLMESTSYAKIPADVKSTLSSELVTTISAGTNWSYDSSAETLTASGATATSYTNVLSGVSEGDLVKLSFDVTGYTGGSVYISCGGGDQNTSDFTNGSHTIYLVSGSGSQKIAFDGGTAYTAVLSNISVKEVTNDLVAYYPLDADNSRGNGTDNVVTGETLGSELVGSGFYTLSNWTSSNTESNPTATSVKFVRGSDNAGGYIYLKSANNELTTDLTVGTLYKITFTYTTDDGDAYPTIKDSSNNYYSFGATSGEKVLYYEAVHATADRIMFQGVSAGTFVQIADVSIKEVTSNTGVLK